MNKIKIYIAGPLFSLPERNFNRALADALESSIPNCTVILPQEHAKTIAGQRSFVEDMFNYCMKSMVNSDVVVAVLDGPDADSGTCVEIGYAHARQKPIIGIRTDVRASEYKGVNLMVSRACTETIWLQDSSVQLEQVLNEIIRAIKRLTSSSVNLGRKETDIDLGKGDRVTK